jgi:peptidoglycan/xylan/chitin deacetylase (PgdA/CDA1 family)
MLRTQLGGLRRQLLCSTYSRPCLISECGPIVSFCFDDFPRTAYTTGGTILKSMGARGTYYAALGLQDSTNTLGDLLRSDDIFSLLADGHEIGCHTYTHSSCRDRSLKAFEGDVQKGRELLHKMTGCDAPNFSYPYGHVTLAAKKKIGAQMTSCRGIYGGVNRPTADLNLLRANSLYGDVDQFARVKDLVSESEQRRGWLIFYTHDVRRNPSPFGCTPALLDSTVSLVLERGLRVAPIGEVIASAQGKTLV